MSKAEFHSIQCPRFVSCMCIEYREISQLGNEVMLVVSDSGFEGSLRAKGFPAQRPSAPQVCAGYAPAPAGCRSRGLQLPPNPGMRRVAAALLPAGQRCTRRILPIGVPVRQFPPSTSFFVFSSSDSFRPSLLKARFLFARRGCQLVWKPRLQCFTY